MESKFQNINDWLLALDKLHQKKEQTIKCVNCPDDWKDDIELDEENDEEFEEE